MSSLQQQIEELKKGKQPTASTEKLKKVRGKNGGKREGSGRKTKQETLEKRGHKELILQHVNEQIEVTVLDKKTGKTIVMKKPALLAMMEKLRQAGMKGDVDAINKWLDRALGKPVTKIAGDEDAEPIRLLIDF